MAKMVGMSRAIKPEWLEKTVSLIKENKSENEIKREITEYLSFEVKDSTNLNKSVNILMNIWVKESAENSNIREFALCALDYENTNRLAIHWSMILLAYPVFSDVCGLIGKISNVQGDFTTSWLKEKLFDLWGERTTLLHATNKVLQTLKQIEAIENEKVGVYRVKKYKIVDIKTIQVLLMTILSLKEKAYYEMTELSSVPQMFPFDFTVSHEWLHNSDYFTLNNFGGKIVLTTN